MPPILKTVSTDNPGRSRSKFGVDSVDFDQEKFVRFGKWDSVDCPYCCRVTFQHDPFRRCRDEIKILPPNIERESTSMYDYPVLREGEDLELTNSICWVAHKEANEGGALRSQRFLFASAATCICDDWLVASPLRIGIQKKPTTKKATLCSCSRRAAISIMK